MEPVLEMTPDNVHGSSFSKFNAQVKLMIWKRYQESTKSKLDLAKVFLPAMLFFILNILTYSLFDGLFPDGYLEQFTVPLAFWIFIQRITVHIMYEKASKLKEAMKMMGLSETVYWFSYFISDGIILGFALSFLCTLFTVGGLFNSANFFLILFILFIYSLSCIPFSFFITSFFDSPGTAGQALLGILIGLYVLYIIIFIADLGGGFSPSNQYITAFIPPVAFQQICATFANSYDGVPLSDLILILIFTIPIYSFLAYYITQIMPTDIGVQKPWNFLFRREFWSSTPSIPMEEYKENSDPNVPVEFVDERIIGKPSIVVSNLKKTYGPTTVVNDLSFKMYPNQIFALLGHNGAGKTTTISMLTGLIPPDHFSSSSGATIYGFNIGGELDKVRSSMGVCPQHDVLFENLTVQEHILFFSQLKGFSLAQAQKEAQVLTKMFHLDKRTHHLGSELSGGQKRKLSVGVAVCGGSKFVVLDEPTAGMDPLARRELWDLLTSLRKGRTMLLTTHYMDEADVLGDRVGIMSLGQMKCMGSTQFLKTRFGSGYKLMFVAPPKMSEQYLNELTSFIHQFVPEAKYFVEDGHDDLIQYSLPFDSISKFGQLFDAIKENTERLSILSYSINISSLEDVFLKVGEDHTVKPTLENAEVVNDQAGIGSSSEFSSTFYDQVVALILRRLQNSYNDFITIPLLLLPMIVATVAAIIYSQKIITDDDSINDLFTAGLYLGGYLGAPGLIAEFIVRERNDKLKNVLTVVGCDYRAYWAGTFIADYILLSIPTVFIWFTWGVGDMNNFIHGRGSSSFFVLLIFNVYLIFFSYFFSFVFSSPKSCISMMPIVVICLILAPLIAIMLILQLCDSMDITVSGSLMAGILIWGIMLTTPHGALYSALLDSTNKEGWDGAIKSFPPYYATMIFMIFETGLFIWFILHSDSQSTCSIDSLEDPSYSEKCLRGLDEDVLKERQDVLKVPLEDNNKPLRIDQLRKVFYPTRKGQKGVIAAQDVTFHVDKGEIFGLLGANGAGKTTTLSMLTRHLIPSRGDAYINNHSILTDFRKGATNLGVVTQNNSLWDKLSVEAHLKLFARLRGVPSNMVDKVVDGTIDQLELQPHRHKLSMRLSGGMKRKLCVAIALIGDPKVVLLDEPSAGLDPVSRRNLWTVILRTMSHRAVILTTHSMDEAEALCQRIGIMVRGQMRALGTKHHLKNKFGSGFELTVKLTLLKSFTRNKSTDNTREVSSDVQTLSIAELENLINSLTSFIISHFPSAFILAKNGTLITYQIPKEDMDIGKAFTLMEANAESLQIEDYTIAQPTLEQVFIRIVNKYDEIYDRLAAKNQQAKSSSNPLLSNGEDDVEADELYDEDAALETLLNTVVVEVNKCGCTNYFLHILIGFFMLIWFLFWGLGIAFIGTTGQVLIPLGSISMVITIIVCCIRKCSCCQQPKDDE